MKLTTLPRWRLSLWGGAAGLLAVPWLAMQFTREVIWDGADFLAFGAMLLLACTAFEVAVRLTASRTWRAVLGAAIALAFLLVWVELAVGLFD